MVDCKKIIFLLLVMLFRHKALVSCSQMKIKFQMSLQLQMEPNLKLVSLHCWLGPDVSTGDNMAPLIEGGHQVMDHGDDNSTEEKVNAQLYLKLNGTKIDPFETPLIDYRYSVLSKRNISASYYISEYDPFYAEFSCVDNSTADFTTTNSDLVFAYAPMNDSDELNTLRNLIIAISVLFVFTLVLLIISCVCYCICAARRSSSKHSNQSSDVEEPTISQSCSSWLTEVTSPRNSVLFNTSIYAVPDSNLEPAAQQHNVRQRNWRSGTAFSTKTPGRLLSDETADHLLCLLRHPSPCNVPGCLCSYYRKKIINSLSQTATQGSVMATMPTHTEEGYVIPEPVTSRLSMKDGRIKKHSPSSQAMAEKDFGYQSLTYSDCEKLNVETVKFDCNGGSYSDENHEVYLRVPKGAIPKGKIISIQVGVSFHSALVSLLPREVRPVSPLVKLCVMEEVDFKFLKPVRVTLPHFLDVADEEDAKQMGLQFMKCGHGLRCFHQSDGEASFKPKSNTATLRTTHFCTFCITANKHICSSKINYRLVKVIPKNRQESMWRVNFCVTYYLKTCLQVCTCSPLRCCVHDNFHLSQVLKKQFPDSSFEMRTLTKFKFSEPETLEIYFERRLAGGWQLALEKGGKVIRINY